MNFTKDSIEELILDLIDDDKLEEFKERATSLGKLFILKREEDLTDFELTMMASTIEVKDYEEEYETLRDDLTYEEYAMTLIYACANTQVSKDKEQGQEGFFIEEDR